MLCSISGNETSDAVISPKSGGIFDRKLAATYISNSGKDPLNDEPMAVDELITVANTGLPVIMPPKPSEYHSIPTMLSAFQNEWDAVALEVFSLRKQLQNTRQELSIALYKYDAAIRVATAAIKDKEEAQKALQEISEAFASKPAEKSGIEGHVDEDKPNNIPESSKSSLSTFVDLIGQARETLFALHKQSKPAQLVTPKTGVTLSKDTANLALKGSNALVVDLKSGKKIVSGPRFGTLCLPSGTKKPAFDAVAFLNEIDESSAVGITAKKLNVLDTDETIEVPVNSVKFFITHPSEPYFVAVTKENNWVLAGKLEIIYSSEQSSVPILAADFHVDGALLGLASAGKVEIVDLTKFEVVSTVEMPDFVTISKVHFALNGYWLFASGTTDKNNSEIRIYDLRKNTLVHTFAVSENAEFVVDPMCQVLVVCDKKQKKLHVHLYTKKGKKWLKDVVVEKCGALHGLQADVQGDGEGVLLKVVGLLGNDLVTYEISGKEE